MSNPAYDAYLASDEWKVRRKVAIDAAEGRCQLCNSDKQPLHAHHRTYERFRHETAADIVVLCQECHEKFHGKEKQGYDFARFANITQENLEAWIGHFDKWAGTPSEVAEAWTMIGALVAINSLRDSLHIGKLTVPAEDLAMGAAEVFGSLTAYAWGPTGMSHIDKVMEATPYGQ